VWDSTKRTWQIQRVPFHYQRKAPGDPTWMQIVWALTVIKEAEGARKYGVRAPLPKEEWFTAGSRASGGRGNTVRFNLTKRRKR